MKKAPPNELLLRELLSPEYMNSLILQVRRFVFGHIRRLGDRAFNPLYLLKTPEGKFKPLTPVDLFAERLFIDLIGRKFPEDRVVTYGEESLTENPPDFRGDRRICILIDMIDGTDLLQRDLSNWCSAVVVFDPTKAQIEGAFVALSSEVDRTNYMYFATRDSVAYKRLLSDRKNHAPFPLNGPAQDRHLRDASVCLYGQKSSALFSLLSLYQKERFVAWLKSNIESDDEAQKARQPEIGFRFYNLAGNPMMVRMADGIVDIVFELKSQAPHDVVPGAFIACKAGAIFGKPTGEKFSMNELAEKLLTPGAKESRVNYILAANEDILKELARLLS